MATLYSLLAAMQEAVSAATTGLTSSSSDTNTDPLNVEVGIGWPSEKTLQNNVRSGPNPSSLISIYDRGMAQNTTRWQPHEVGRVVTPATLTATVSGPVKGTGTATIAIGGSVTIGDAVAVLITPGLGQTSAQVAIAAAGDTLDTMAAKIASAINADPDLSALVIASTSGPIVTITAANPSPTGLIYVAANVGNGASRITEIGRRRRQVQVAIWTRTEDDRITVGDAVEACVAGLEADFGLTFTDGTIGRLLFVSDNEMDDATLSDTYRRDFIVSVDYAVTVTDALFAVIAPIARNTTL